MRYLRKNLRFSKILFVIIFLLPIDWFYPTGSFFREAGAKPVNLFIVVVGIFFFLCGHRIFGVKVTFRAQPYLLILLFFGSVAFILSYLSLPELPHSDRSRTVQFIAQTSMLMMFMFVLQVLIYLFHRQQLRKQVLKLFFIVSVIHLSLFCFDALRLLGIKTDNIFLLFRNEAGLIERPSGLMSEPSYYGTFAAMYALPLMFFCEKNKFIYRLVASLLLVTAFAISAKTMFVVALAQAFVMIFFMKMKRSLRIGLIALFLIIAMAGAGLASRSEATNLEENLSSIMRIGSSVLAFNVAKDGYALLGIGTGQFHFMYLPQFAPSFLFLSQEGQDQLYAISESRASTFNLPLRILVEMGVCGFLVGLSFFYKLFFKLRNSIDRQTQMGICMVAGSIGFLLTQDTYCFPFLAFGIALAVTERK